MTILRFHIRESSTNIESSRIRYLLYLNHLKRRSLYKKVYGCIISTVLKDRNNGRHVKS